ncbi:MAG: OPT/YSL family transporter [Saprospiraceae bacterium]|nr:OPT/YSL family transporter [Saprospiraceae bacterium]MBP7802953.1 OPT/YSL family transporter [Saprospiraceae bacterium]MBP8096114.1 OPT/YSL family transporter [Saprospiraceae bacterium]
MEKKTFKPYVPSSTIMPEFTWKSILLGAFFGIVFGAATVYLGLKAGLTVSASIPIAVLAISIGRRLFNTTILENNIIQTTGSAGESIAGGVAFTLPAFLFLSASADGSVSSASYFNYLTILTLAMVGGILGTLLMIPLRRPLIIVEHDNLPYPEGTACASVLIAGEKGGDFAKTAYLGLAFATVYAVFQKIFHFIAETPTFVTSVKNKFLPSATLNADITPEYLGVGYIIGPRIAGVLVAGGVLAWLALNPLLATLVPAETIANQLIKLGYLADLSTAGGPGGWDPETGSFANTSIALYRAFIRQIGAGAVTAGGLMTLVKTIPTIIASFKNSFKSLRANSADQPAELRTDKDVSIKVVLVGSLALVLILSVLPGIPGDTWLTKIFIGVLILVFGILFVTVSSRITGLIGTSSNPISGMTIATLMGTALIFIVMGWTGQTYEPMAMVVGSIICIAAANAGNTSQDLKTGYLLGATPRYQQISLFIGTVVSSVVIGLTIRYLDQDLHGLDPSVLHAIGSDKYPAPQGTLLATLVKGLLSFNLDWQFVLVGAFISVVVELCGANALSFAVGLYLPLSTTLPIFIGGMIKGLVDMRSKRDTIITDEDDELSKGKLFATGLVAGGALAGVIIAILSVKNQEFMDTKLSIGPRLNEWLGDGGYNILGTLCFIVMAVTLYRIARQGKQ